MTKRYFSSIEPLEARIAPAVFFIGSGLAIRTAAGVDAQDTGAEDFAATATDASGAVLLSRGDVIYWEADGNSRVSRGDVPLLTVVAGRAMVFFTDGLGSIAGSFDKNEMTGLMVSDGFRGIVHRDLNGPVVTALSPQGTIGVSSGLALSVFKSNIPQLVVNGQVARGGIFAGGSIANVAIGTAVDNGLAFAGSLQGSILTGLANEGFPVSFNSGRLGSPRILTLDYTLSLGEDAGDILNVRLRAGMQGAIRTGPGGDIASGAAGDGGDISGVRVPTSPTAFSIIAGTGGLVTGNGASGRGGNVSTVSVLMHTTVMDEVTIRAGHAQTAVNGQSGAGGNLTNVQVNLLDAANAVYYSAGGVLGSPSSGERQGAPGGSIRGGSLTVHGTVADVSVRADVGGNATTGFRAGDGGSIAGFRFLAETAPIGGSFSLATGYGGKGGEGGNGGLMRGVVVQINTSVGEDISMRSGDGGETLDTGKLRSALGGSINRLTASLGAADNLYVTAGGGGARPGTTGSTGGSLTASQFILNGEITDDARVTAGIGGGLKGNGTAGAGGNLTDFTLINRAHSDFFTLQGGNGGSPSINPGPGIPSFEGATGAGGSVLRVVVQAAAVAGAGFGEMRLQGGIAGSAVIAMSNADGGNGGAISGATLVDRLGATEFQVVGGYAANGLGNGDGGHSGSVSRVVVAAPLGILRAGDRFGAGSAQGPFAEGGDGGLVSGIAGTVKTLYINAPAGGTGTSGIGGTGGSISNVNVAVTDFAQWIVAGNGGNGGSIAGSGGSVTNVRITGTGDIGNFQAPFGFAGVGEVQGGIAAGRAGSGSSPAIAGSVIGITAHRIASILAGAFDNPLNLSAANAVTAIAGITLRGPGAGIGVDLDNGGTYSFGDAATGANANNGMYQLGDGDEPIDGLVIVKAGAARLRIAPLKLIQV